VEQQDLSVMTNLLNVLAQPYNYQLESPSYQQAPAAGGCGYETFCGT
jgi:uncharacterized protein YdiU (UPF0061 family)